VGGLGFFHTLLGLAFCHVCIAQTFPVISAIPDMAFPVTQLTISTNFTVADAGWPAEQLRVTASSSNTNFVRDEDIVIAGNGSNRTVTITRQADYWATNIVTVVVSNPDGNLTKDSFGLKIAHFSLLASFGGGITAAAAADFNNDGNLDLLHDYVLYQNNGDGTFSNTFLFPLSGSTSVAWGDYNNDGYLEPLLPSLFSFLRLYANKGNGTFATNVLSGLPKVLDGIGAWGDFDNDGWPDLLLAGSTNSPGRNVARLYRNNRDGTFTDIQANLQGVELCSVAWGDYDNDGRLDFAILGGYAGLFATNLTRIYHNNGDGTFTDIQAGLPQLMQGVVTWGDYDNDGYLDLLVTGNKGIRYSSSGPGLARVYHNNRNGTFSDVGAGLPPVYASSAAWGDFDNDGFLDIVLSGKLGGKLITQIYHNNGDGTFTDIQAGLPGMVQGVTQWGDFNGDGRLDLLLSWDGPCEVYQNNARVTNEPPSAPTSLAATVVAHNNVVLTWAPAIDKETTNSAGLYYNLRVGTTPGGSELFSPQSDLTSGQRRLPNFGNAGHTNSWLLSHLSRGTYYWSVQAIDTGLAGGRFAVETSFTVTNDLDSAQNHPPVSEAQNLTIQEDTTANITLTGSDIDGDSLTFSILHPPSYGFLVGNPPHLVYVPFTNYFGADSFDFHVYDGLAVSPPVTVSLNVTPVVDVQNLLVSCQPYIAGEMEITVTGEPYQGYEVQASSDLLHWEPITSFTSPVSSSAFVVSATNWQFFRAKTKP
jgi:hypothetical protein